MKEFVSSLKRKGDHIRSSVQMLGVWETFKAAARSLLRPNLYEEGAKFDKKYGTDTNAIMEVDKLEIQGNSQKHAIKYQPLRPKVLRFILNSLEINYSEFVFFDVGSGKGRNILLASHFPFRKSIGIEISPVLHNMAERNLKIYQRRSLKCDNLEVHLADATNFDFPKDNIVFLMYYPFKAAALREFLKNIERSLRAHPRRIFIVNVSPRERSVFDEFTFLKLTKDFQVPFFFDWCWCLYETVDYQK